MKNFKLFPFNNGSILTIAYLTYIFNLYNHLKNVSLFVPNCPSVCVTKMITGCLRTVLSKNDKSYHICSMILKYV